MTTELDLTVLDEDGEEIDDDIQLSINGHTVSANGGNGDSNWTLEDGALVPATDDGSISVEVAVIDGSRLYIQDEEPEEADEEDVWIDTSE